MFAFVLIRVLACVGLTLIPLTLFNLWYQEEVACLGGRELTPFRAAVNVIIVALSLAVLLSFMS